MTRKKFVVEIKNEQDYKKMVEYIEIIWDSYLRWWDILRENKDYKKYVVEWSNRPSYDFFRWHEVLVIDKPSVYFDTWIERFKEKWYTVLSVDEAIKKWLSIYEVIRDWFIYEILKDNWNWTFLVRKCIHND